MAELAHGPAAAVAAVTTVLLLAMTLHELQLHDVLFSTAHRWGETLLVGGTQARSPRSNDSVVKGLASGPDTDLGVDPSTAFAPAGLATPRQPSASTASAASTSSTAAAASAVVSGACPERAEFGSVRLQQASGGGAEGLHGRVQERLCFGLVALDKAGRPFDCPLDASHDAVNGTAAPDSPGLQVSQGDIQGPGVEGAARAPTEAVIAQEGALRKQNGYVQRAFFTCVGAYLPSRALHLRRTNLLSSQDPSAKRKHTGRAKAATSAAAAAAAATAGGGGGRDKGGPRFSAGTLLAAQVLFATDRGVHEVCLTPPRSGTLKLDIRLLFTNAHEVASSLNPANSRGYTGSPVVLSLIATIAPLAAAVPTLQPAAAPAVEATAAAAGPAAVRAMPAHLPGSTKVSLEELMPYTYRKELPRCTLDILDRSRGEGFWEADVWHPLPCVPHRLPNDKLLLCLNGRNILFLGDSEMRYSFGVFLMLLSYPSRDAFLRKYGSLGRSNAFYFPNPIKADLELNLLNQPVKNPGGVALRRLQFKNGPGVEGIFCGSVMDGFSLVRIRRQVGLVLVDFNVTYVTYMGAGEPTVARSWMSDPRKCGGNVAFPARNLNSGGAGGEQRWPEASKNLERAGRTAGGKVTGNGNGNGNRNGDGGGDGDGVGDSGGHRSSHHNVSFLESFDYIAVGSQLHEVRSFASSTEYEAALRSRFEQELRPLVRGGDMGKVIMFGAWAAREDIKPSKYLHQSNNVRGLAFEEAAEKVFLTPSLSIKSSESHWKERTGEGVGMVQDRTCCSSLSRGGSTHVSEQVSSLVEANQQRKHIHFLRTGLLTMSRPELCSDSTHYSWPVTLAMLDLWLGSACASNLKEP